MKLRPNIHGRITNANKNYDSSDIPDLAPLHPEELGREFVGVKQNRIKYEATGDIPDRLPTADLLPYPIDEHEFIGQFETKKNIYLLFAHAYNKVMEKLEALEDKV